MIANSVKPMAVEGWLKQLELAPKTQGHIKGLMSTIFKCAQRWELIESNPLKLVRVKDVSKRLERPTVLTVEEFLGLLAQIREPYRTMVLIAGCLGLRASEIVGLQWSDFDFGKLTLLVQRGVVHGRADDVKTEYSHDFVPLAPELAAELLAYRDHCHMTEEGGCSLILPRASRTTRRRFKRSTSGRQPRRQGSPQTLAGRRFATATGRGWTRPTPRWGCNGN